MKFIFVFLGAKVLPIQWGVNEWLWIVSMSITLFPIAMPIFSTPHNSTFSPKKVKLIVVFRLPSRLNKKNPNK